MAHLSAVAHYTRMALEAAAMAAGRARFETAPELPADDEITPDEAHDRAVSELLTTAEPLADWIAKKCDCDQGRAPIDLGRLEDVDLIDCDRVPVLLAAMVAGDWQQQKVAAGRLAALYLKAERKTVATRAAELLKAGVL